ncbi:MAG: ankyrin repeat domain-containing protein, partial [Gammaproteobacteria bacterium]|nr:ankyrin repeat domain-containing protein [Gammaproteobacteria bacterium]
MTKLLLEYGDDIHLRSGHEQRTPLELAAINGYTLIVSLLLEKNSAVIKSDYGFAVLHQVIKSDINLLEQRVEVAKLLLSMGANPDALDEHGNTPLLTAVEHNRPSFIKVLVDEHANLEFIGKDGNTPLHKAIIKGNKQLVKSILDAGANLEGLAYNGFTPLIRAVKLHHEPIARLLLKKGALPEAMCSLRYTPLAVATGIGDKPLVKLLLQYNANIEALSQSNLTPLCIAVQKNNISLVRYLIKKDASIKPLTVTLSWCTRYAKALATEHPNSIANMDLFIQNALQSGSTKKAISISPYNIAVILGHKELIKLFRAPELLLQPWNYTHPAVSTLAGAEELHTLFKAIADWDKSDQQYDRIKAMLQTKSNLANMSGSHFLFKTSHGRVIPNLTPLYLATQRNHARLVNLLLKFKANPNVFVADRSPLEEAISKDNKEIVNLLLQNGANINMVTTPLIHASDKGSLPVIKLLVKKGANIHSVTGNGRTALLNAIQTGNLTIVRFLLEHGAMDNTALHEAIIWNKPYLVDLLLEYTAPVNALDADGRTPLFLAVSEKKIKMAQALLSRGATLLTITKSATKLEALFIHSQSWVKKRVMEFINNAIQKGANRESISMSPVDFTLIMSDQEIINLLPQYHFGPTKSEVKSHNGTGSSSSTCLEIHEPDALQSTELYVSDDEIPVANNIPAASSSYPGATSPEAFNIEGAFWNDGFFTPQSPQSNQVKEPSQEIVLTISDDDEPTIELLASDDDNVIEVFTDQTANEEYSLMTAPIHHNSPQITSDSLSVSSPLPQLPEYVESSNSTSSNSSSGTSSEALNLFNPRCSKISQKYMGGVLEYLPSQGGDRSHHVYTYNKTIDLTPLKDLFAPTSKTAIELNTREYSARFYSNQKPIEPSCQHTFIFGARKEKAWIPAVGKKGRCILVLSKEEYAAIGASLPDHIDALVLTRLQSETHGDFNDNLSLLTPRRLVVFLFAHQMKLPHFIMMDDNITKLRVNEEETGTVIPDFSSLYTQLQSKLDISPCISLTTESNYEIPLGKLGSKMFLMDMQAIRTKMYEPSYLFYLFPHSGEIKHCAEDYFFQLFLHHMQPDKANNPGYHILPKEEGVLLRDQSKRTKNSGVQASIQAKEFSIPEHYSTSSTTPDFLSQCLNSTIEDMNFIIQNNFKIYNQKKELLKNAPIYSRHASARRLISGDQEFKACKPAQRNQPFVRAFKSKIANCYLPEQLYNYQTEAIRSVASLPDDIHSGEFAMATGSGKSLLKFTLAAQAFDLLEDKECIALVAPHIKDVAQLWNRCIEYHRLFNEQSFSERHMLTVSSESTALGLGLLNIIDELQRQRNIFIFCAKSFEQFCTDDKYKSLLERVRMVLLDESHVNDELAKRCLTTFNRDSDTLVFGFSATPDHLILIFV